MDLSKIVVCFMCITLAVNSLDAYRVAISDDSSIVTNDDKFISIIQEAAKLNVDMIMLPKMSTKACLNEDTIQKVTERVAHSAKDGKVYVALEIVQRDGCGLSLEEMNNNMVFDRNGDIVVSFRTPGFSQSYNTTPSVHTLTTDFGVTFAVLTQEYLFLNAQDLDGIKDVIAFGVSVADNHFLFAEQLPASWSFATKSNLITSGRVYGGQPTTYGDIIITELHSEVTDFTNVELKQSINDLNPSDYSTKVLDLNAASRGYEESVCHASFCCEFQIATTVIGSKSIPYNLVAYDGVHDMNGNKVGVQACAMVACGGHQEASCDDEIHNSVIFDELTISGVFQKHTEAYPVIVSNCHGCFSDALKFNMEKNYSSTYAAVDLLKKHVSSFGILGLNVYREFHSTASDISTVSLDLSQLNVDFQDFFDYVWIRLRILIFIVSIYVLEMM